MDKSDFYTLQGYRIRNKSDLTEAMEDYLEMIYRLSLSQQIISIKNISESLNVKPSSVSKMCARLKKQNLVFFEKYGNISLTEKGTVIGSYLLWRHQLLESLLKQINQNEFHLEQVEKIEHFIDLDTLKNIEHYIEKKKSNE